MAWPLPLNRVIRTCYLRLVARGKPKKVARCAAARTVLEITGAVVTTKTAGAPPQGGRWQPGACVVAMEHLGWQSPARTRLVYHDGP